MGISGFFVHLLRPSVQGLIGQGKEVSSDEVNRAISPPTSGDENDDYSPERGHLANSIKQAWKNEGILIETENGLMFDPTRCNEVSQQVLQDKQLRGLAESSGYIPPEGHRSGNRER